MLATWKTWLELMLTVIELFHNPAVHSFSYMHPVRHSIF